MKPVLVSILLLLLMNPVFANDQIPDSIVAILQSSKPDTVKIDILNQLSVSFSMNHPGKMMLYADSAIFLSLQIKDSLRLAQSYNRKGVACHYLGDHNNALQYFLKSVNIKENMRLHEMLIPEYNNIGMVLRNMGQNKESLRYYLMAMQICHEKGDKQNEAKIWNNIGTVYRQLKQYKEAQKAYERALEINESLFDLETYVMNLNNLGNLYKEINNYDKALYFYNKAISRIEPTDNYYLIGLFLNNLSELFILHNQLTQAEESLTKATAMIEHVGSVNLQTNNTRLWSELYEKSGDFGNALLFRKKHELLKDSITISERATLYEHLKSLANLEQKVKEIDLLRTINTIQKKQISDQRFIQIGTFLFSLLLIATLLLLVKYLRTKDKLNNSLQKLVDKKTFELQNAMIQAEKSDKLKSAFLANISHEVRTPMNAIVGFSNLVMNEDLKKAERDQFLQYINTNTLRLLKLFDNVTMLAKFEQNDVHKTTEIFTPYKLVNLLITKINDNNQVRDLICEIQNRISPDITVITDKTIFGMVMEELIDNAIKFTKSGEISISAQLDNNTLKVLVTDTGIGIAPEHLPNVFDKFTKFEASLIPGYDGPGIGLSIVKWGIECLNGQVKIDSQKNMGTTISFSIPVN